MSKTSSSVQGCTHTKNAFDANDIAIAVLPPKISLASLTLVQFQEVAYSLHEQDKDRYDKAHQEGTMRAWGREFEIAKHESAYSRSRMQQEQEIVSQVDDPLKNRSSWRDKKSVGRKDSTVLRRRGWHPF